MRRLEAAALVDGHVDHDRAGLHELQHVARHQLRGLGARNQHRTNHQVGRLELLADVVLRRHERLDVLRHDVGQIGQTRQRDVADGHVGTHSGGRTGCSRADHAGADDEDLGRLHARNATEQLALAAARLLEEVASLLGRHAAGNLRHGNQQRQRTVRTLDGFVGAADGATLNHRTGERFAAGEVEVGEDQLVLANEFVFGSNRFLDLDNHLGPGVDLFDGGQNLRTDSYIGLVGEAAVDAGRSLNIYLVAPFGQFVGTCGGKSNAVLVVLNLFGNTDNHCR